MNPVSPSLTVADDSRAAPNDETSVRLTSTVTRTTRDGRVVYVKRYEAGDWGRTADVVRARAAREIELLDRLSASGLFAGRLGLVSMAESNPNEALLTTWEVPGRHLLDVAVDRHSVRASRSTRRALWLAGRWLRAYQQLPVNAGDAATIGDLDPANPVEYCRVRLDTLASFRDPWATRACAGRFCDVVTNLMSRTSSDERRDVWCHGDYGPGNLIWDGRTLTPIDFGMAHVGSPLLDLTYLIHRLEMLAIYFPWRRWPLDAWRNAALRGYGNAGLATSPLYRLLMLRHLLCRLQTYVRRRPDGLKQRLHNAWVRARLRRELDRRLAAESAQ